MKSHRPHAARAELSDLTDRLRLRSHKITGARQAILELLRRQDHPLTIKEIRAALRGQNCDLATVYRSIHLLKELQMVRRFEFGDGPARFELVSPHKDDHHHHLVCTRCRGIVEVEECFPPEWEQRIARHNGFKSVTHKLEFFGLCPKCQ